MAPESTTDAPTATPTFDPAQAATAPASATLTDSLVIEVVSDQSIRPFRFEASDEALADLRRRILDTRWPDRETVPDDSQGVQLATMQKLAAYWATDYDWRKCEARLNALPNFLTEIDGLDVHFIHVRSKHRTRCRSSSPMAGRARSSSSSRSSNR